MTSYRSKPKQKVEAYDAYTHTVFAVYRSSSEASRFHNCKEQEICESIEDNSYIIDGIYFKNKQ